MDEIESKKVKISTVITAFLIILAFILAAGAAVSYRAKIDSRIGNLVSRIPYPAVIVNYNNFISTAEVNTNLFSVKKFYESQDFSGAGMRVDFTTDDGKKRLMLLKKELLNKMLENKAVEILAKRNGITLTADDVSRSVSKKADEAGSLDALEENISRLYGWKLEDFEAKVVKPGLYAQELEKKIMLENKENFSRDARKNIEEAKQKLNDNNFAEVANSYSQGPAAGSGGEIGWFAKSQLMPEISDSIFSLKKGQRSDIIESEIGFHIVEVEDRKTDNGADLVKLRQIFTPKKLFADWLSDQMKLMKIYVPLGSYGWEKNAGRIDFTENGMKEFEKIMKTNFQGDASLIF